MNEMKEFIAELGKGKENKAFDFIANNYHAMSKNELAGICKGLLYAISEKADKYTEEDIYAEAVENLKDSFYYLYEED